MARVSIEDCLDFIENRFALVSVAAHRTRQLIGGEDLLVRSKNKEGVSALREIAEGMVISDSSEVPAEAYDAIAGVNGASAAATSEPAATSAAPEPAPAETQPS